MMICGIEVGSLQGRIGKMGEAWFAQYERLEAEYPDATEDELCDMVEEALIDSMSSAVDAAHDAAKYGD